MSGHLVALRCAEIDDALVGAVEREWARFAGMGMGRELDAIRDEVKHVIVLVLGVLPTDLKNIQIKENSFTRLWKLSVSNNRISQASAY